MGQSPKQVPSPPPRASPAAAAILQHAAAVRPLCAAPGPDGGGQEIASPTPAAPRELARPVASPSSHARVVPHAVQVVPQRVPPTEGLQSRSLTVDQTHVTTGQEFHSATSSSYAVAPVPSIERLPSALRAPGSESDATVLACVEAVEVDVKHLLHVVKQKSAVPDAGAGGSCCMPACLGPGAGMQQSVDRVPDDMCSPIFLEGSMRVAEGSFRVAAGVGLPPHRGGRSHSPAARPAASARAATPVPDEAQQRQPGQLDGGGSTSAEYASPRRKQKHTPSTNSGGTWSPYSPPPTCKLSAKTKRAGSSVDLPAAPVGSLFVDNGAEVPGPDQETVQVLKAKVAGLEAQLEDMTGSHKYLELQLARLERHYCQQGKEGRAELESLRAQVESLVDVRGCGGGGSGVWARWGARPDSPNTSSSSRAAAAGASKAQRRLDSPDNSASRRAAAAAAASKGNLQQHARNVGCSGGRTPRGHQAQRASPRAALGRAAPPPRR